MKKLLSILLALAIVVALAAGCNNNSDTSSQPPETSSSSPPPTVATTGTDAPETASPNTASPDTAQPGETEPDPVPQDVPIMISAQELQGMMGDENLILIGVVTTSIAMPWTNAANPLYGSYLVWTDDYFGANTEALSTEVTLFRTPLSNMEALLSKAGVTADSQIVVYSSDWLSQGAYVVWQLSMMGLNVRFLDGGVSAWRDNNGQTGNSNRLSGESVKSDFRAPSYNPSAYDATIDTVIEALQNPGEWVVIDVRETDEYNGGRTSSSGGAFGTGRLKGAVHINWERNLDPQDASSGILLSREQLMDLYSFIGDRKVIVYCQGGVRSSYTWIVLKELGFDVLNYDGSWIEWSYAASTASDYPNKDVVLSLTEEWNDNGRKI